jgi:hypothetical protein
LLTRLAVDSGGFAELAASDSVEVRASQRLLLFQLLQCAIIMCGSRADGEALIASIKELPQELRKLWGAFLLQAPPRVASEVLTGLRDLADPAELSSWAQHIRVALVSTATGSRIGLQDDAESTVDPPSNIELTRLVAPSSPRLAAAGALQRIDIPAGETRDTAWSARFAVAASLGDPATILDRYAVEKLGDHLRQGRGCGLAWFLNKLASAGPTSVHLITRAELGVSANTRLKHLQELGQRLPQGGITSLTVTFAHDSQFARESHCRHVRFGRVAVQLESGLTMFDAHTMRHSMPCSVVSQKFARERENKLERSSLTNLRRHPVW